MTNLAYLFTCVFKDGSTLQQTSQDVSAINSAKNAFYDVLQRLDEVQTFTLSNGQNKYSVNLEDGHFEVNGVPFSAGSEEFPGAVYRLIYFHRHKHQVMQGRPMAEAPTQFFIGWQTTLADKNIQETISVQ